MEAIFGWMIIFGVGYPIYRAVVGVRNKVEADRLSWLERETAIKQAESRYDQAEAERLLKAAQLYETKKFIEHKDW